MKKDINIYVEQTLASDDLKHKMLR